MCCQLTTAICQLLNYSERSDFTGFVNAAFIAWKLTTEIVINNEPIPAAAKIHQEICSTVLIILQPVVHKIIR